MTNYNERLDEILDRVYLFGMNGGLGYEKFENELSGVGINRYLGDGKKIIS